ncbi:protein BIG GRAIN 1-like A [Salvia splendens]|uniref:protein BIG GRAIN 1-like A n=1 Tax=Salvia splendens TaxID=180675 RepID=UPI0010FFCDF5|nr:protein BIG GRAIN 1-like A [Salvia splendens]
MRNKRDEDMAIYQRTHSWVDKFSRPHPQSGKCSSSGSSCGGGFFSSLEPKSLPAEKFGNFEDSGINWRGFSDRSDRKSKSESRLAKTKLKALKMYKSVKQPISPSGKVAAFLNSLFAAGNLKKQKIDSPGSSFSRSWHTATTTTPSSSTPSIRFFPASTVILDEDCRLQRQTGNSEDIDSILDAIDEELAMHMKNKEQILGFDIFSDEKREFEDGDDEFDGASCASSDLFELENLSAIGMEELPLYQTTHLPNIMQMD